MTADLIHSIQATLDKKPNFLARLFKTRSWKTWRTEAEDIDRKVSQWLEHGRLTDEERNKLRYWFDQIDRILVKHG